MSRIRSRQLETESVPTRVLRKDAATSDKIGTYAVREGKEKWPGSRRVRANDLTSGAVQFLVEQAESTARPATLLLQTEDVEVDGETVEFTDAVRQQLVDWTAADAPTGPSWPWAGTVMAYVDADPGDYQGAFTVEVLFDDVVQWTVVVPGTSDVVRDAGRWEVVVEGVSPPVAVTNEAETDWVYGWVS